MVIGVEAWDWSCWMSGLYLFWWGEVFVGWGIDMVCLFGDFVRWLANAYVGKGGLGLILVKNVDIGIRIYPTG